MAKVSVIIPIYNSEKYLDECLASIAEQTLGDIEIICVNDGSTDGSAAILERWADKDSRFVVVEQQNAGVSHARNVALDRAYGEYIAFVDSDDVIAADFLEKLYTAAKKYDADIAMGDIRRLAVRRFKVKIEREQLYTTPQAQIDAADIPHHCYIWNKIYRREALKIKFVEGRHYEDVEWSIKAVYYANKVVAVPGTAYFYRKHGESITQTWNETNRDDCDWARSKMMSFAREHRIRLSEYNMMLCKTKVTVFGITVLKIYSWGHRRRYKLFGIIPFMTVKWR